VKLAEAMKQSELKTRVTRIAYFIWFPHRRIGMWRY
jgi:hypothetical protein